MKMSDQRTKEKQVNLKKRIYCEWKHTNEWRENERLHNERTENKRKGYGSLESETIEYEGQKTI